MLLLGTAMAVLRYMGSGTRLLELKSLVYCAFTVSASYLTLICLNFLICEVEIVITSLSLGLLWGTLPDVCHYLLECILSMGLGWQSSG